MRFLSIEGTAIFETIAKSRLPGDGNSEGADPSSPSPASDSSKVQTPAPAPASDSEDKPRTEFKIRKDSLNISYSHEGNVAEFVITHSQDTSGAASSSVVWSRYFKESRNDWRRYSRMPVE